METLGHPYVEQGTYTFYVIIVLTTIPEVGLQWSSTFFYVWCYFVLSFVDIYIHTYTYIEIRFRMKESLHLFNYISKVEGTFREHLQKKIHYQSPSKAVREGQHAGKQSGSSNVGTICIDATWKGNKACIVGWATELDGRVFSLFERINSLSPLQAEARALKSSISLAISRGWQSACFKTDSLT